VYAICQAATTNARSAQPSLSSPVYKLLQLIPAASARTFSRGPELWAIIYLTRPLFYAIMSLVVNDMSREPKSLQEAILYFSNPDNCIDYLAIRRWPDGKVVCPTCACETVKFSEKRRTWTCAKHHAKREFSVKVGTIMEDSPIALDKWLTAMWLLTTCKNGISSYEIARDLKVTQKSAWFMLHRIRLAMQDENFGAKLSGEVEADETFIGGKARNMHKSVKARRISGTGGSPHDKMMVMGMLERGGRVRTRIVSDRLQNTLQPIIEKHVEAGSAMFTDEHGGYKGLHMEYEHEIVDHALEYVNGRVHVNGMENFWSLLKRGLAGTYVAVEPFHLFRYLDEQVFRFNNRATKNNPLNDADRFDLAVRQIVGKRLTFAELTGKSPRQAVN
jgi:transposase-like protein